MNETRGLCKRELATAEQAGQCQGVPLRLRLLLFSAVASISFLRAAEDSPPNEIAADRSLAKMREDLRAIGYRPRVRVLRVSLARAR